MTAQFSYGEESLSASSGVSGGPESHSCDLMTTIVV